MSTCIRVRLLGLIPARILARPDRVPSRLFSSCPQVDIAAVGRVSAKRSVEDIRPFSDFLTDTYNRRHDYLRISITERCNLRCRYCMPKDGVQLSPQASLLTTSEIFYLASVFVSQGVSKIRLTGGEPTVRKDFLPLVKLLGSLSASGLRQLAVTTNGISLYRKLDDLVLHGVTGINISLDTLDAHKYQVVTRRTGLAAVLKSIDRALEMKRAGTPLNLKLNCVVMRGINDEEIPSFVELARDRDLEVRFIEYMPFGGNRWSQQKMFSFRETLGLIRQIHPSIEPADVRRNDTSKVYQVPGFRGRIGFITSMTSDFCSSCNRLRITSDGSLKVCLHGAHEVSMRDVLRTANSGLPMDEATFQRLSDGPAADWPVVEHNLLQTIAAAVKGKREKHAGMRELERSTNRPMILIGG